MATWAEARAAKTTRTERECRHYTPDLLGVACRYCRERVPIALNAEGYFAHPTCDPEAAALLALDAQRRAPARSRT